MAGPVASFVDDLTRLTFGNVAEYMQGKETKWLADGVKFTKRYTPGGSLWYGRLAFDRLLFDRLQLAADPEAYESFSRIMAQARRDYDQEFFWRPGDRLPARAPELGTALGR